MRKPVSDTVIERYGKAFSYGPRLVDSEGDIRPPAGDEEVQFFGVYKGDACGHWEWIGDAHDEDSAQRFAQWMLLVP